MLVRYKNGLLEKFLLKEIKKIHPQICYRSVLYDENNNVISVGKHNFHMPRSLKNALKREDAFKKIAPFNFLLKETDKKAEKRVPLNWPSKPQDDSEFIVKTTIRLLIEKEKKNGEKIIKELPIEGRLKKAIDGTEELNKNIKVTKYISD